MRVGADQSEGGGYFNGPVDTVTNEFAYISIPEDYEIRPGLAKPYTLAVPALMQFGWSLPKQLTNRNMHLDPDFSCLTYGDQGKRAVQIKAKLGAGDFLAFYSGLRACESATGLVYALVGFFVIDHFEAANQVPVTRWDENAHTRRVLPGEAKDIVIHAREGVSGRLARCLPIGIFQNRAYRVREDLLSEWGGLSIKDGYLQRSAQLPEFNDPNRFLAWFHAQRIPLVSRNN